MRDYFVGNHHIRRTLACSDHPHHHLGVCFFLFFFVFLSADSHSGDRRGVITHSRPLNINVIISG